jgi:hypothetical protein
MTPTDRREAIAPESEHDRCYREIKRLTERQRDTLGRIYMNDDTRVHPATASVLERKGLIESFDQVLPGRFRVIVKRYQPASWAAHIAYCRWASENCSIDDKEARS